VVVRSRAGRALCRFDVRGDSAHEIEAFSGEAIRRDLVSLHLFNNTDDLLSFYMGKNTPERQDFIVGNLKVERNLPGA
jgi:topoisomerase-4 subunit B